MASKNILVTGATSGIGRATALELARRGCRVLVHGRDEARCREVADECAKLSGEVVPYLVADLASLTQVRSLAEDVRTIGTLDVLVANAGVYLDDRLETVDGYEATFAVNHLAHFLLTNLLLDTLEQSAPSRVVVVSSQAHQAGRLDFNDLMHERSYDGYDAYADSKLANVMFTYALAKRLDAARVTANCLHPGSISTKLLHAGWHGGGLPVERGAETPVYLSVSPDVEGVTAGYYVDEQPRRSSAESYDEGEQERLWEISERLVGLPVALGGGR